MSQTVKTGELPDRFDEMYRNEPDAALLVAKRYLSRNQVIDRIEQTVGIELDRSCHSLTMAGLIDLYRAVADHDTPSPEDIAHDHQKFEVARLLVDALDANITVADGQDGFRKVQQVRLWFALYEPDSDAGVTADPSADGDADSDGAPGAGPVGGGVE